MRLNMNGGFGNVCVCVCVCDWSRNIWRHLHTIKRRTVLGDEREWWVHELLACTSLEAWIPHSPGRLTATWAGTAGNSMRIPNGNVQCTSRPSDEVEEAVVGYLKVIYLQLPGQIHESVLILEFSGSNPGAVYTVKLLMFVTRFSLRN
jgi:hypothetical protein